MGEDCLICQRIALIKKSENPFFVKELETGYVVLGDHQFFTGYTLFLCKYHVFELHDLKPHARERFLQEMSLTAEAVYRAFRPEKLNYELLGNTDPHLHWHIFPRYQDDQDKKRPIWNIDKSVRNADEKRPSEEELTGLRKSLRDAVDRLVVS